jgi:hypothetical protein
MRKILILTIGIFLTHFSKSCVQQDDFLIDNGRAGPFIKNMPLDKALQIAQEKYTVEKNTIFLEGIDYTVYDILLNSELLLKLEPSFNNEGTLWRIWIYSDRYKTNKGIGVGSTIADVLENYTYDSFLTEGSGHWLKVKETNVGFSLDSKAFTYEWMLNGAKFENIPKDTKITFIIP